MLNLTYFCISVQTVSCHYSANEIQDKMTFQKSDSPINRGLHTRNIIYTEACLKKFIFRRRQFGISNSILSRPSKQEPPMYLTQSPCPQNFEEPPAPLPHDLNTCGKLWYKYSFQNIENYASLETFFEPLIQAIVQSIIRTTGYWPRMEM